MKLLLALDIRKQSAEALLDTAVQWAERLSATLDLVFVDPFGNWRPFTLDRQLADLLTTEVERGRAADRKRLDSLLQRIPAAHRGEAHVLVGDPVQVVVGHAQGYDALLLGPGERISDQVGMASLEARLVRHAPGAVLVLHP